MAFFYGMVLSKHMLTLYGDAVFYLAWPNLAWRLRPISLAFVRNPCEDIFECTSVSLGCIFGSTISRLKEMSLSRGLVHVSKLSLRMFIPTNPLLLSLSLSALPSCKWTLICCFMSIYSARMWVQWRQGTVCFGHCCGFGTWNGAQHNEVTHQCL